MKLLQAARAALIILLWPLAVWLRGVRSLRGHGAESSPVILVQPAGRTPPLGHASSGPLRGSDPGRYFRRDVLTRVTAPWLAVVPLILALLAMTAVNLLGHGRLSPSPFGNVFLLARLIHDGPARAVLERDCPQAGGRLCPYLGSIPATSDEFLWAPDSPVVQAGGHKAVSADADAIIAATLRAYPAEVFRIALANTLHQLGNFASGDGLEPWPVQVTPWIARDFPHREYIAYAAARQQHGDLSVPDQLPDVHQVVAVAGIAGCILLLPVALRRRHISAGFLAAAVIALPISAAITGAMSMSHDRYQSRIMWLPSCVALIALGSLTSKRS